MTKQASLTGSWSGAYRYPRGGDVEVVFNAQIEEIAGAFTGAMQEPNTFGRSEDPVLTSDFDGQRDGQAVSFIKFYDGSGAAHHTVRYEGTVDADFTRVEGTWTVVPGWTGSFFMTRDDEGKSAEAEESAAAVIAKKR